MRDSTDLASRSKGRYRLGMLLMLLGTAVIAGWLLRLPELTRLVPGLRGMVFNTALCFLLMGAAMRKETSPSTMARTLARLSVAAVLLLCAGNLLQLVTGISLGIDLASLHAWADDGNPHPGRMALPTTIGFLLAAGSFLLALEAQGFGPRISVLGRLMAAASCLLGGISLLGYLLGLEAMFGHYPLADMALHTAVGMVVLSTGLWLGWDLRTAAAVRIEPSAARLLQLATWAPAVVALLAGVTGIIIFKSRADTLLMDGLRATQSAYISQIETVLALRGTRAALIGSQQGFDTNPEHLQQRLDGFLPFGFSYVELSQPDEARPLAAGTAGETVLELPVHLGGPIGEAGLVWTGESILLRRLNLIETADGKPRTLTSEQPLSNLVALLAAKPEGLAGTMQLCGSIKDEIVCLPGSGDARIHRLPLQPVRSLADPLQLAAAGQHGIGTFRDPNGDLYITVYAPVGNTGLFSSYRIGADVVNAGSRGQLLWGLLLILLVTTTGTWLLRRNIRRQASALLDLKLKHAVVLDSLQEGLMLMDREGNIVSANPACARIMGLSRDEITGRTSMDPRWIAIREDGTLWPTEDFPANRTLRTGIGERDLVMGLQRPDNSLIWLSINTVPAGDSGVVLSLEDITAGRAAALRIKEQEGRLRLMVEGVRDYAIYMLDVGGHVSSWNSGAERIKGYTAEEIIGQHFSLFYPPEDIAAGKPEQELRIVASTGRYEEEGWRLRKDGTSFWAQVLISAVHDDKGQLIGFAKLSRDLSERRRAEQAIAEISRLNEAMLAAAPFSIIATNADGLIRAINPAAERMLWYRRDELVDKATPAVIHDAEEVRHRARELSEELGEIVAPGFEVFVHQSRKGIVEEREWTYIRKDGSRFPVNLAVTALRDGQGAISGFLGIAYDITERKRREEYTQHVAHHDHLTGLPNRGLLSDRLQLALLHSKRSHKPVALLMLDLDHFKRVNDSLGHHIGDALLVAVAKRLQAAVRSADTVARMGGDEFMVVLPDIGDAGAAEHVARNILESLSQPVIIGSHKLIVTPSIGISLYPRDGGDANALMRNADTAMYRAKADGRRGISLFNAELARAAPGKM